MWTASASCSIRWPSSAHRAARPDPSLVMGVGSRVTGMQAGLILAYLAGRVLGQYELFLPPGSGPQARRQSAA